MTNTKTYNLRPANIKKIHKTLKIGSNPSSPAIF